MLWRWQHPWAPDPDCDAGTTRLFTDVPRADAGCGPIEALATAGIINGYPGPNDTLQFQPDDYVSRQGIAAFLSRLLGHASATCTGTTRKFTDVPSTNQFCGVIEWLAAQGVITGSENSDGTYSFHPVADATRQAFSAFLYRANAL